MVGNQHPTFHWVVDTTNGSVSKPFLRRAVILKAIMPCIKIAIWPCEIIVIT